MMEGVCPQGACDMRRLSIRYQGQTVYTSSYSTTAYTTAYTILYTTSYFSMNTIGIVPVWSRLCIRFVGRVWPWGNH